MEKPINPFVFGQVVAGDKFLNREEEIKQLHANFLSGQNTVIQAPRRWGKTSLVAHAAHTLKAVDSSVYFVFLDLFYIKSEIDFYKQLTEKTAKSLSDKFDEISGFFSDALKALLPKIKFTPIQDAVGGIEMTLELTLKDDEKNVEEMLNFPEKLAKKRKVRMVICLDEFQNIGTFDNSAAFQKKLRSVWQHHTHVAYCVYGSKRHMMMTLFNEYSSPFYGFGQQMNLGRISKGFWVNYIRSNFDKTKIAISEEIALLISTMMDNVSQYVQQLASILWINSADNKKANIEVFEKSIHDLLAQNDLMCISRSEDLTKYQVNLLIALIDKMWNGEVLKADITSKKVMDEYNLGTSATVLRSKDTLEKKDILDTVGKDWEFVDPVFRLWFMVNFMHLNVKAIIEKFRSS